jgi:hypothetical protein
MPALSGFHNHGPCTSLRLDDWDTRKGDLGLVTVITVAGLYL